MDFRIFGFARKSNTEDASKEELLQAFQDKLEGDENDIYHFKSSISYISGQVRCMWCSLVIHRCLAVLEATSLLL